MAEIKNEQYKQFIETGAINTLKEEDIVTVLNFMQSIGVKYLPEAQACVIAHYLTGARPNEVLDLISQDIQRDNQFYTIQMKGSKGGLPRKIHISVKNELARKLYAYAVTQFPTAYIFYHFRSNSIRSGTTASLKNGKKRIYTKDYADVANNLKYHFKKWFGVLFKDGIPPYFLRHNRFSKLAEKGATLEDIRQIKGARTVQSVTPYTHLSTERSKEIGKKIE